MRTAGTRSSAASASPSPLSGQNTAFTTSSGSGCGGSARPATARRRRRSCVSRQRRVSKPRAAARKHRWVLLRVSRQAPGAAARRVQLQLQDRTCRPQERHAHRSRCADRDRRSLWRRSGHGRPKIRIRLRVVVKDPPALGAEVGTPTSRRRSCLQHGERSDRASSTMQLAQPKQPHQARTEYAKVRCLHHSGVLSGLAAGSRSGGSAPRSTSGSGDAACAVGVTAPAGGDAGSSSCCVAFTRRAGSGGPAPGAGSTSAGGVAALLGLAHSCVTTHSRSTVLHALHLRAHTLHFDAALCSGRCISTPSISRGLRKFRLLPRGRAGRTN